MIGKIYGKFYRYRPKKYIPRSKPADRVLYNLWGKVMGFNNKILLFSFCGLFILFTQKIYATQTSADDDRLDTRYNLVTKLLYGRAFGAHPSVNSILSTISSPRATRTWSLKLLTP